MTSLIPVFLHHDSDNGHSVWFQSFFTMTVIMTSLIPVFLHHDSDIGHSVWFQSFFTMTVIMTSLLSPWQWQWSFSLILVFLRHGMTMVIQSDSNLSTSWQWQWSFSLIPVFLHHDSENGHSVWFQSFFTMTVTMVNQSDSSLSSPRHSVTMVIQSDCLSWPLRWHWSFSLILICLGIVHVMYLKLCHLSQHTAPSTFSLIWTTLLTGH